MNVSQTLKISKEQWNTAHNKSHSFPVFLVKTVWVYPFFVAAVYFASGMFIRSEFIRLILAVVLSILPWKEAMKKIYSNNYRHMRTQLIVLLQVLCTSVSSGYSIEKSLLLVRPIIEKTFGKRSMLLKPLINLENNLKLHVNLEDSLNIFARQIAFPETVPVFHALAISGEIGNNSLSILRSSCQMLSELNAVQGEIAASNAASIEAAVSKIKAIVAIPEAGEVYDGVVRSVMPYGAFVEFMPGKDGLLHISEIDWKRFETIEEAGIAEGDKIKVKLLDIDPKTGKFKLSRRVLLEKPEGYVERERRPRRPRNEA